MVIQAIKQGSNLHFSFPHHFFSRGMSVTSCVLRALYYPWSACCQWGVCVCVCALTAVRTSPEFNDRAESELVWLKTSLGLVQGGPG